MKSDPRLDELPTSIHILPLDRFILLPETTLPVTFAASWARALVDVALATSGYIGVVQPEEGERAPARRFFRVGCLARVRNEGREADGHRVSLEGVVRFRILAEPAADRDPLDRLDVAYEEFRKDLAPEVNEEEKHKLEVFRGKMLDLARTRFGGAGLLETLTPRQIVFFMAQAAPLSAAEKQALLETHGIQELIDTLALLLSLNYLTTTPDFSPPSLVN